MNNCLFVVQDPDAAFITQNRESSSNEPFTIRNGKKCKKKKNGDKFIRDGVREVCGHGFCEKRFCLFLFLEFQKAPIFCIDLLKLGGLSVWKFFSNVLVFFRAVLLRQLFLLYFQCVFVAFVT